MKNVTAKQFHNAFWLHPKSWLAEHGEVAVGTLMDVADNDGRSSPALKERLSLTAHAVALHADAFIPRTVRSPAASISLGIGWAVSFVHLLIFALLPLISDGIYHDGDSFLWASVALCGPWFIAGTLSILRHPDLARWVLLLAVITPVALVASRFLTTDVELPATMLSALLATTAVIALVGTPQSKLVVVSGGVTTVALIGVLAYSGLLLTPYESFLWGTVAWENLPAVLAMCLAAVITLLATKQQRTAGGLALITLPWVAVELGLVWRTGDPAAPLVTVITIAMLVIAGIVLKALGRRNRQPIQAATVA